MLLTEVSIKALKAPKKGVKVYTDDTLIGFGVRVSEGGGKSYVVTYGPTRKRETIGKVGLIKLKDARDAAKRIIAEHTLGKFQPRAVTWKYALTQYLTEIERDLKQRTHADYKRLLERHFSFGETKLVDLTYADYSKKLDKLAGRPSEQNHAYAALRTFMQWAFRKHYVDRNPIDRMEMPHPYVPRERVLSDAELCAVWNAAGDDDHGKIVKLCILTGQRRSECAAMRPSMLSGDVVTMPQKKRTHSFPVNLAKSYLLTKRFTSWSRNKNDLDQRSGVNDWTLHDLRRTFRTNWARIDIPDSIAERYINHLSGKEAGIQAVYNRYTYLDQMREALAKYEAWFQALLLTSNQAREASRLSNFGVIDDAVLVEKAGA